MIIECEELKLHMDQITRDQTGFFLKKEEGESEREKVGVQKKTLFSYMLKFL